MRLRRALAALLLLAGVALAQGPAEVSVLVQTATAVSQSVRQTIRAYGAIEPDPDGLLVVALPRAGLITHVYVRLGDRVAAGDPLLVLDTAPDVRMQFTQAQAAQVYAEGQLKRTRQLFADQLATRDEVAAAERALSDAKAQLAAMKQVGADQNRQVVRAVADGIVTGLSISAGDRVAADTTALILARSTGLVVRLGIEPEDARRLPANAPVELESVFQDGQRVSTRLEKVGVMINASTRLVDAVAPIPDAVVPQLTLGSTMRADIKLAEQTALVVPRSAVLRDQDGDYLFAVDDGRVRRVDVIVVYESSSESGVAGELQDGTVVITSGNYELSDGMAIRTESHGG